MHLSHEPLSFTELLAHDTPDCGALVLFSGEARNHNEGKGVLYLEYEAQENLAEASIAEILKDAADKFSLTLVRCVHRLGRVNIGESSIVIVTASGHRQHAYEANRYIIDRIKLESPIWKQEFYSDGGSAWGK